MPNPNNPPPGAPPGWRAGAQTVLTRSENLAKAARGVAAFTMEGNDLAKEKELILMLPAKP
jgi:hypothetical protein